ncbi:MAG: FixH family protein [Pseudomonadota bacterium]
MFQTLFGGAVLIVVIFYVLRAFGVSNYWRGVISGTVSVTAYLALSIGQWPGGDVVSMHMAVFLATATVLTLIEGRKPGTAKRLHWGPKAIIGFFLVLFVIDGALLMISGQGVPPVVAKWLLPPAKNSSNPPHTAFSGVVSHGEEAAKTISQFMKNAEKQHKLGWAVTITGLDKLRQGGGSTVSVTVLDVKSQPLKDATVKIAIARPGLTRPEQLAELLETNPGVYRGELTINLPGMWVAALQVQRDSDRFEQQQHVEVIAAQ